MRLPVYSITHTPGPAKRSTYTKPALQLGFPTIALVVMSKYRFQKKSFCSVHGPTGRAGRPSSFSTSLHKSFQRSLGIALHQLIRELSRYGSHCRNMNLVQVRTPIAFRGIYGGDPVLQRRNRIVRNGWNLVIRLAIKVAPCAALARAAPLLEEERNTRIQALISNR